MNDFLSFSGIAALGTCLSLLASVQQPVQAQAFTRSVSTPVGQSRTVTNQPGMKTVTYTRADGSPYTRNTYRGEDGQSTVLYGPAGRPLERQVSRESGTATVTVTGVDDNSGSRTTSYNEDGPATTTVSGSGGRSATRTFDHGKYYRHR